MAYGDTRQQACGLFERYAKSYSDKSSKNWIISCSSSTPGRSAVKALLTPAYTKLANKNKANLYPKVENEEEAQKLLSQLNRHAFYLKIERGDHVIPQAASSAAAASSQNQSMVKQPRLIRVDRMQGNAFEQDGYYMWCIEGSQLKTILGAIGLVTVVLAGCMFPLWPTNLRIGVWYLSIGILGLIGAFFGLSIFRLVFWLFTKVAMKPGIWIFPKLFDDVGFVSSFTSSYMMLESASETFNAHIHSPGRIIHSRLGLGSTTTKEDQKETKNGGWPASCSKWRGFRHQNTSNKKESHSCAATADQNHC